MKTALVLAVAALALGCWAVPALAAETRIADVPPDHWAYKAVKELVDRGYLGLYSDRTFRGDQPVDRYTLAVVVSRLLGEVVAGNTPMGSADANLLRRLTEEFRKELVTLSARSQNLEKALAQYERDRAALGADMAAWRDETGQAREQLAEALREIVALREELAKLAEETSANTEAVAELQERMEDLSQRNEKLEKDVRLWKYITFGLGALLALLL